MTITAVAMPKLGMSMEEGTVIDWPIAVGGHVAKGEIVLVIESEKTEAEIEATATGVLRHVYVEAGAVVPCRTLLAALTATADEPFDAEAFAREYAARVAPERVPRREIAVPSLARVETGARSARRAVAPAARALARRLGVDLDTVPGSGPGGRVVRQDVEAFAAARERRVRVEEGVSLEVLREGAGEPVVFLPGFGADLSAFAPQTRALARDFEVIGVHPRGVGASDAPDLPAYEVAQTADDVAALCSAPVHVVGASLGAAAALEMALRHAGKVRSLVLVTPFLVRSERLGAVTEAWTRIAAEASPETLATFLLPWLFSDAFLSDQARRARTARGLARAASHVPAATLARSRAGLERWSGTRAGALASIRCPCLVLLGGADLLAPDGRAVAAGLPHARVVALPEAGHGLSLEAADEVAGAIAEHLSR